MPNEDCELEEFESLEPDSLEVLELSVPLWLLPVPSVEPDPKLADPWLLKDDAAEPLEDSVLLLALPSEELVVLPWLFNEDSAELLELSVPLSPCEEVEEPCELSKEAADPSALPVPEADEP